MLVTARANLPPALPPIWKERWEGQDAGLLAAWIRGLEKRAESPEIAAACRAGELPVLAWRGGVEKHIKGVKSGTLLYLATWQGLRGDDLQIDTDAEVIKTCARHGVTVVYTARLPSDEESEQP